jgi:hypothetical protein
MNPNCPICRGIGWVCENHPEKPWDSELGCVCGAGAPCKRNETDGVDEWNERCLRYRSGSAAIKASRRSSSRLWLTRAWSAAPAANIDET